MALPVISNARARAIFLSRHLLADPPSGAGKGGDLHALIAALGFVQIDSVQTVARAHHMILHARSTSYRPPALARLHAERRVFEHWTHDASFIDMAHWPHWRLRFARNEAKLAARWEKWGRAGFLEKTDEVMRRIADHGPCSSSDVGEDEARAPGGWWDWHPSKAALEYLWRTGHLSVTRRDAFRKVYDITEKVIPPERLNARFTEEETVDWACRSALERLGFATPGELAAFWDLIAPAEAKAWCAAASARGEIVEAGIEMADGSVRRSWLHPAALDEIPTVSPRLRILSPFDPALRDRGRAERIFGFDYRIEIFVPEAKRTYGYYVFPIIEGDRLVGRIDMKATDRLHVRALWPERGVRFGKARRARLETALARTARLAAVRDVTYEPDWLRSS